jgi:hypothetical protein
MSILVEADSIVGDSVFCDSVVDDSVDYDLAYNAVLSSSRWNICRSEYDQYHSRALQRFGTSDMFQNNKS